MTSLCRPSLQSQGWQTTEMDRRPHSREKLGGSSSRYLGVHHRPFEDLPLRLRRHSLPSRHRRGHPLAARAAGHVSAHRCASSQASRTGPRRVPARVGSRCTRTQAADERRSNRADTVLGMAHLRRMRGASAAHARCICGAYAVHARCCRTDWIHDERCKHRRLLGSENPLGTTLLQLARGYTAAALRLAGGYAAATVPIRRSSTTPAPRLQRG